MPINKRVQRMFKEYLKSLRPMKNLNKYLRVLDKLVLDYNQRLQLQEMIKMNKLPKAIKIQLDHLHKIFDKIEILEEAADQFIQTEEEVDEEPTAGPAKAKNVKQVIKPKTAKKTTKAKMTNPATGTKTAKPATRAKTAKTATKTRKTKMPARAKSHYRVKATKDKTTTVEQRTTRAKAAKAAQQAKKIKKVRNGAKV